MNLNDDELALIWLALRDRHESLWAETHDTRMRPEVREIAEKQRSETNDVLNRVERVLLERGKPV